MFKLVDRAKAWKDAAGDTSPVVTHVPGSPAQRGQADVSDRFQPTQVRYNTQAPPAVAFASGSPYLDRPLPAPPPGKAAMLERPSTSGGPGSKSQEGNDFGRFNKFDKRVSRDDFYISMKPRTGTGFKQPQYATFHGQIPTPEGSPQSKPSSRPAIPTVRMPTPDSMEDGSAPIGMALGSPTHQPANWGSWSSSQQTLRPEPAPVTHPASPLSAVESVDSYDMPKEKKQPGKRKLFGIFSRRHTDQSSPALTISEPNHLGQTYRPDQTAPKTPHEDQTRPSRSATLSSQKGARHKPIVIRSQTMPYENGQPANAKSTGFRFRNPSIDSYGTANPHERSTSNFGSIPIVLEPPSQTSGPMPNLLNVEIPQSSLERYSVMFQGVLETQPTSASSLLARRQATVKELKKISDAVIAEEVRFETAVKCLCLLIIGPGREIGKAQEGNVATANKVTGLCSIPFDAIRQAIIAPNITPSTEGNTSQYITSIAPFTIEGDFRWATPTSSET
ncbi:hypothetical protein SCAR479_12009 [Seiridium cardinale]|uniref:Uncharacterized protein n=1 Tax=Seiridium cardinale TaxID=138064 RepID=A0ABR2XC20_9PEZI